MRVIDAHTEMLTMAINNTDGDQRHRIVHKIIDQVITACALNCLDDEVDPIAFERIKEAIFECN